MMRARISKVKKVIRKIYKNLRYNKRELVERFYLVCINSISPLKFRMNVRIKLFDELDDNSKLAISKAFKRVFGSTLIEYMDNYAKPKWFVLGLIDKRIVSFCFIVEPDVIFDDINLKIGEVGGIGGVMVLPSHRSFGLTSEVLKQADTFIFDRLRAEYALLLCKKHLTNFYNIRGWYQSNSKFYYNLVNKTEIHKSIVMLKSNNEKYQPDIITVNGKSW